MVYSRLVKRVYKLYTAILPCDLGIGSVGLGQHAYRHDDGLIVCKKCGSVALTKD